MMRYGRSLALWCTAAFIATEAGAQTSFPVGTNDPLQVKLGYPLQCGFQRYWLKGSDAVRSVTATWSSGASAMQAITLDPPFYTAICTVMDRREALTFTGKDLSGNVIASVPVPPGVDFDQLNARTDYSALFYGCFQPFKVQGQAAVVDLSGDPPGQDMLAKFHAYGVGQMLPFVEVDPNELVLHGKQVVLSKGHFAIAPPLLMGGTGDQVYVDAGYDVDPKELPDMRHPLSAWEVGCKHPMPLPYYRCCPGAYYDHLDRMYRSFGSFGDVKDLFQQIPQVNVWDDHEIRDGWGSQGDEFPYGKLSNRLAPFYYAAKDACWAHQMLQGPPLLNGTTYDRDRSFERSFNVGGIKGFAFDLRSDRDTRQQRVISPQQWVAFDQWCNGMNEGDTIILISSIPLFYKGMTCFEQIAEFFHPDLKDDLGDSWNSRPNRSERDELIQRLLYLRLQKKVRIMVVSGDLHKGMLMDVWFEPRRSKRGKRTFEKSDPQTFDTRKLLAVELMTTGLYHAEIPANGDAAKLEWVTAQDRKGAINYGVTYQGTRYRVSSKVRWNQARQNFGAIESIDGKIWLELICGRTAGDRARSGIPQEFVEVALQPDFDTNYLQMIAVEPMKAMNDKAQIERIPSLRKFKPSPPDRIRFF